VHHEKNQIEKSPNNPQLSALHLNAQSVRNKINELGIYLAGQQADIICLSEHWLNEGEIVNWPGYAQASVVCRKSRGGGAAIYTKDSIQAKPLDVSAFSVDHTIELSAVDLTKSYTTVITAYRPPSGDFEIFLDKLGQTLEKLYSSEKVIILAGDFNIELVGDRDHDKKAKFLDLTSLYNLKPTINVPTRVTAQSQAVSTTSLQTWRTTRRKCWNSGSRTT
jgi:exonuclease III